MAAIGTLSESVENKKIVFILLILVTAEKLWKESGYMPDFLWRGIL